MGINQRFRDLRYHLRLSQIEMAQEIGLTTASSISHIEQGKNQLTNASLQMLAQKFNVNQNWLMTGEGSMFNESGPTEGTNSGTPLNGKKSTASDTFAEKLLEELKAQYERQIEHLQMENSKLWKLVASSDLGKLQAFELNRVQDLFDDSEGTYSEAKAA